jgi:mannose-6-phosphate isomerase
MDFQNKVLQLKGVPMQYAWGGYQFIPELLAIQNTENKPFAEYWMGAHSSHPSQVTDGKQELPMNTWIAQNAKHILGSSTFERFKELPYLFKVLDVKDMLSIQVHPTREEAIKGFEAEDAAGIPINASNRNYKDKNHKPEVMVALSDFWLLHGFKKKDALYKTLENIPEFNTFIALFKSEGYKELYKLLMEMHQADVNNLLLPLVKRELRKKKEGLLQKDEPGWWVCKLFEHDQAIENIDRGVFSIYLFNIVKLLPGEAIFQDAGIPHAYLEGQNVELMANSDNVLRGGLTPKHIDVPELLKHTQFEGIIPNVLKGTKLHNVTLYPCPVADFGIAKIQLQQGDVYSNTTTSLEILIIMQGAVIVKGQEDKVLKRGHAIAVAAGSSYQLTASGGAELYKAFVP